MSVRSDIEDATIAWLVSAGASGGIPSPDSAVILADEDGERPALPYLTVRLIVHNIQVHEDEDLIDDSLTPLWRARGQRTGTVAVNGFGAGSEDWIERAHFLLRSPAAKKLNTAAGVAFRAIGGMNNLSSLLDGHSQVRFEQDFAVDYQRDAVDPGDTEGVLELAEVVHEDTWQSEHPSDRTVTITEVL